MPFCKCIQCYAMTCGTSFIIRDIQEARYSNEELALGCTSSFFIFYSRSHLPGVAKKDFHFSAAVLRHSCSILMQTATNVQLHYCPVLLHICPLG